MPKRSRKPRSRSEDGRAAWRRRNSLTGRTPLFPQPLQGIDGVLQLKHLVFKVGDDRVVLGWCRAHGSPSFRSGCAINVIGHSTQGRCSDPAAGIHQTLRVTPAMEAGVSDHVWSIEEIVGLLETHWDSN